MLQLGCGRNCLRTISGLTPTASVEQRSPVTSNLDIEYWVAVRRVNLVTEHHSEWHLYGITRAGSFSNSWKAYIAHRGYCTEKVGIFPWCLLTLARNSRRQTINEESH